MHNDLGYLLDLIDDPNQEVYNTIESNIIELGKTIVPDLEDYWENCQDKLAQNRIEGIIQKINFNFLFQKFAEWIPQSDDNLIRGVYLTSLIQYPNYEFSELTSDLESIKRDLWLEMNNDLTALEKIRVLNHVFFKLKRFKAVRRNPASVNHFFVNNLLSTRSGNQYAMSMLYMTVAQSIDLPVYGVRLPLNYLLAYNNSELARFGGEDKTGILFYINPYNEGSIFGRNELHQMLIRNKAKTKETYFYPSTNLFFITQVLKAMLVAYQSDLKKEKTEIINRLLDLIDKNDNNANPTK